MSHLAAKGMTPVSRQNDNRRKLRRNNIMSASLFLFTVSLLSGTAILTALMWMELGLNELELTQSGESSLGKHSIQWLAGAAFVLAGTICLLAN